MEDPPPMPPKEWLRKHTDVSDRAAAGAGWQEGWLAGRTSGSTTAEPPPDLRALVIELRGIATMAANPPPPGGWPITRTKS